MPVDVDISGGISMGKTIGDFYNYGKKPANLKVALEVKARDFIELFLERIGNLARQIEA
jgi:inosine-uridine nucleoside N-ribohydrolase